MKSTEPRRARIYNRTRGVTLAERAIVANDSKSRRTGLLHHERLETGEGIWIVPCEAVHTFGMKFAIDVVFLRRDQSVAKIQTALPRRRIAVCLRAYSVVELPAGTLAATGTQPGDQLDIH